MNNLSIRLQRVVWSSHRVHIATIWFTAGKSNCIYYSIKGWYCFALHTVLYPVLCQSKEQVKKKYRMKETKTLKEICFFQLSNYFIETLWELVRMKKKQRENINESSIFIPDCVQTSWLLQFFKHSKVISHCLLWFWTANCWLLDWFWGSPLSQDMEPISHNIIYICIYWRPRLSGNLWMECHGGAAIFSMNKHSMHAISGCRSGIFPWNIFIKSSEALWVILDAG